MVVQNVKHLIITKVLNMLSFHGVTTIYSILVLSRAIEDNTDLGINVEKSFSKVSEAVEDIACPTIDAIAYDQSDNATLHQFNNRNNITE